MRLVETKTYRVDIAGAEREHIGKICDKLEEIANVFRYKDVYYAAIDEAEYKMDIEEIDNTVEFLRSLAEDKIEVY
jgi:hypothetical protein